MLGELISMTRFSALTAEGSAVPSMMAEARPRIWDESFMSVLYINRCGLICCRLLFACEADFEVFVFRRGCGEGYRAGCGGGAEYHGGGAVVEAAGVAG